MGHRWIFDLSLESEFQRNLRLWAAGGDVQNAWLAERPAACRQCRDAAAATHNDAVEAGK